MRELTVLERRRPALASGPDVVDGAILHVGNRLTTYRTDCAATVNELSPNKLYFLPISDRFIL